MHCTTCDAEIQDPNAEACPVCRAGLSPPTVSVDIVSALSRGVPPPRDAPKRRLLSGTLIGDRYRIVRDLGRGGMGTVYQADDLKLNVPVALKFLSSSPGDYQRRLELLLNEVRLARQITHPNVCRIYDVGDIDGQHFLSMEYVEGEDLASLLRRIGRLPHGKAIHIGLEICHALKAAHARGILHRDLKPSNLMIDAKGHAKVMDFGLAVFGERTATVREIAGTPGYMAPEQRGGHASVQTDIYAVGLILYELFTGRRARKDLLPREDSAEGSPLPAAADDLDPLVERIIRHCLERDPGLRPSSINAVATALTTLAVPRWQPCEGLEIPFRRHWILERRLGRGGFGETWLAVHTKTGERRVFKFCHDSSKLRAFQREMTLFRFMRDKLGPRDDIAALLDWQLDEPPFFIESAFARTGNLQEWIQREGGLAAIPFRDRLDIIRRVALALAAAHSVGVLHKDVKPANILVYRAAEGPLRVQLCDFGVGVLTERERLEAAGLTAAGFTEDDLSSSDAGTRLYMAPETIEGKPATTSADVYALGVMLYQMAVADLTKALAPGWDRDVDDDLLREDISLAVDGAAERRISAAELAERLRARPEREAARIAQRGRDTRARRGARAARRRRNLATAALGGLMLLGLGLGFAFEQAESSARRALIDQTLRSNEAMIRLASAAVADKLESAVRRAEEAASDPALRDLLARTPAVRDERTRATLRAALQGHLDRLLARGGQEFSSWAVSDQDAFVWARAPYDPVVVGRNFRYREWFNGKEELRPDAHVEATPRRSTGFSHAFVSAAQKAPVLIGLASPVFAGGTSPDAKILGVLNAGIHLETFNAWLAVAESRPGDRGCPDRFILLLHRGELLRHPCPAPGATPLPIRDFSKHVALEALFKSPTRRTTAFIDPLQSSSEGSASPALAVARPLDSLLDWALVLEQDVDAALRPITALTDDFHRPAHYAVVLGLGALTLLAALLWWGGQWRAILQLGGADDSAAPIGTPGVNSATASTRRSSS
jgi:serine/threonine protein kinase